MAADAAQPSRPGRVRRARFRARRFALGVCLAASSAAAVLSEEIISGWACGLLAGLAGREQRGRRRSAARRALAWGRHWVDLEDIQEGDTRYGVVKRKLIEDGEDGRCAGLMIDIGANQLALLEGPSEDLMKIRIQEKLKGLKVDLVDQDGMAYLSFPGLDKLVANRTSLMMKDLRVGDELSGRVTRMTAGGVHVNVGAEREATITDHPKQLFRLRKGEAVEGLIVEGIDVEMGVIDVRYPGLYAKVKGRSRNLPQWMREMVKKHLEKYQVYKEFRAENEKSGTVVPQSTDSPDKSGTVVPQSTDSPDRLEV